MRRRRRRAARVGVGGRRLQTVAAPAGIVAVAVAAFGSVAIALPLSAPIAVVEAFGISGGVRVIAPVNTWRREDDAVEDDSAENATDDADREGFVGRMMAMPVAPPPAIAAAGDRANIATKANPATTLVFIVNLLVS